MEAEIENVKKAMWIMWSWNFNPDILSKNDLDWFYEFILRKYVEAKKDPNAKVEPITVRDADFTETQTPAVDNVPLADGGQGKV